jgi:Fe-S cluster assembly ATP-binding protein
MPENREKERSDMLEIRNLHASVDGHEILKGVNLTVGAGEVHSIMGPNGSGKSTLAQVIAGRETYEVTDGQIRYNGRDLLELAPKDRAGAGVAPGGLRRPTSCNRSGSCRPDSG